MERESINFYTYNYILQYKIQINLIVYTHIVYINNMVHFDYPIKKKNFNPQY